MRALQLFLLATCMAAIYFAQYFFDLRSLSQFFPRWLLVRFPNLARYLYILPEDLVNMAVWLAVLAGLGFGLLSAPWVGDRLQQPPISSRVRSPSRRRPLLPLVGAMLMAGLIWFHIRIGGQEVFLDRLGWLAAIVLLLYATARMDANRPRPPDDIAQRATVQRRPLALVLFIGGLLFGWQLFSLPVRIPDAVAEIGLFAHGMAYGGGSEFFTPNANGLLPLSHVVTATFIRLYGEAFAGTRLAGWIAGMGLLVATWALGRELLRRTRVMSDVGNVLEDDGGWLALLAVASLAAGYSTVHFARLPLFLETVICGTFALWALLRGMRRSSLLLVTVSGLLTGLAVILTPVGIVYLAAVPLSWLGAAILQPRLVERRRGGVGWAGPLLWTGGLLVVMAPVLGFWTRRPELFVGYLQSFGDLGIHQAATIEAGLWPNLKRTLLTFNLYGDTSALFAYPGHLLDSTLAPLFVLGVGALIFNLDRLLGWIGLFVLATGIVVATAMAPATPYWPMMLPLLPITAMAIAFGIDRVRLLLLDGVGEQFQQVFVVAIVGLLLWALLNNWLDYYRFAILDADAASHTAMVVRDTAIERSIGLVVADAATAVTWDDPPMALVAVDRAPELLIDLPVGAWPGTLPAGSRVLVQPANRWVLTDLAAAYPGGVTTVTRDMHANPVIYVYDLP